MKNNFSRLLGSSLVAPVVVMLCLSGISQASANPDRAAWIDHSKARTRTYAEIQVLLMDLARRFPDQVKTFELGENNQGLKITGVKIGNGPLNNLVVGTHHGNEYGATEVALGFAGALAEAPIVGQTVYVIPVLNTSGYDARRRWEASGGRNRDPNRDYPGPCGSEGPFTLKSTAALAQFIDKQNIVTSATLHTFYPAVVYPWGLASRDLSTPYDDIYKDLVKAAAQESGYQTGNSTEIIYAANGTYEDYAYWQHGIWSILFELGYSHSPDVKAVEAAVKVNIPGIRRLLEVAPRQRAEKHGFDGRCSRLMALQDRHDE